MYLLQIISLKHDSICQNYIISNFFFSRFLAFFYLKILTIEGLLGKTSLYIMTYTKFHQLHNMLCLNRVTSLFLLIKIYEQHPLGGWVKYAFVPTLPAHVLPTTTPTEITGLCCSASLHSNIAFWSFDVSSSYHCAAETTKC